VEGTNKNKKNILVFEHGSQTAKLCLDAGRIQQYGRPIKNINTYGTVLTSHWIVFETIDYRRVAIILH